MRYFHVIVSIFSSIFKKFKRPEDWVLPRWPCLLGKDALNRRVYQNWRKNRGVQNVAKVYGRENWRKKGEG